MPRRRLKKGSEALEVSAFINLIVVLVPFLLSTAVFSHMAGGRPDAAREVGQLRRPRRRTT